MRELFLALLAGDRGHGYELKQTLEQEFGELFAGAERRCRSTRRSARLERDGLVVEPERRGRQSCASALVPNSPKPGGSRAGGLDRDAGVGTRLKDEFFMKFVGRRVGPAGRAEDAVIAAQRREYLQSLRDLDALLAGERQGASRPSCWWKGAILHRKADLEWLDSDRATTRAVRRSPR